MESKFVLKKPFRFNDTLFPEGTVFRSNHQDQYYVHFSTDTEEIVLTYEEVKEYIKEVKSKYDKEDYLKVLKALSEKDTLDEIVSMINLDKEYVRDILEGLQSIIK